MAHKIFSYDTSKVTGGRNTNKATIMIKQTEINLLENKKQAPFTGYSGNAPSMKESFITNKTGENNSTNESFSIGKFVSHSDLEQRDKALTKFIQENVSKQINHAIEKFKSQGLKEMIEKSLEPQKEEIQALRKIIKSNEETINDLKSEKVNYEQTLAKIEIVLERQFASVSAAGSFNSIKEGPSAESVALIKEDIKALQIGVKNLKENILSQINEHLSQGLSALSSEQEKMHESLKKLENKESFVDGIKKLEESVKVLDKKVEKYGERVEEEGRRIEENAKKIQEAISLSKNTEKKEGASYEITQFSDPERFKVIEIRLENCLSELVKTKERIDDTLSRKLDSAIFETFKLQERQEMDLLRVDKKPTIESVFLEKRENPKIGEAFNENIEEKIEVERQIIINSTPMKEFQKSSEESEKKPEGYEDWLAKNKESVNQEIGKSPEILRDDGGEMKRVLEGEERISEIRNKEEELTSEIQRDFESINNAMGERRMEEGLTAKQDETQDKIITMKNQESIENDDEGEIIYNIDEQGFLIDEKGNYILDDEGKMVKLSPEHIEYLRESNMYEEEFVTK